MSQQNSPNQDGQSSSSPNESTPKPPPVDPSQVGVPGMFATIRGSYNGRPNRGELHSLREQIRRSNSGNKRQ